MLLGDEANMHALGPAKLRLDRIALHYAALQWCSIPWRKRGRGRTRNQKLVTLLPLPRLLRLSWFSDLSSLSLSLVGGNICLIIYAAQVAWNFTMSYIILAHTFLYTWTRVCYEGAHKAVYSQEETSRYSRYIPVYVCIPTCTEVRASSVRELLLVGFLGHARQIPVGYIFSLGYPMGKWRRNEFEGISKKSFLKIGFFTIYVYTVW